MDCAVGGRRLLAVVVTLGAMIVALAAGAGVSAAPTELFFSEYIEGSSFNKAVEIYNGTGAAVDLGALGYKLELYSNGSATVSATLNLTGTVAAGDVFVAANPSANAAILAQADATSSTAINWNGDDAVVLRKGSAIVDVIGQVGFDPGTEWGTGLTSTADNTIRRKGTISQGDTNPSDAFDPAAEWDGFAVDTFSGLGSHTLAADDAPSVTATTPAGGATDVPVNANVSITFSEPVNVVDPWYTISCTLSGSHAANVSGGPTSFTIDPILDFAQGETCTVSIAAASVSDQDANDPPDTLAGNYVFSFTTFSPPVASNAVLLSEVYGGGGNAGATFTNDFIELYNRSAASVSLSGWSVQYASSTGSSWQVTPLSGSIPGGGNYLVQEAAGAGGTTPLPGFDASGSIAMAAGAGKVALVSSTAPLTGTCPTGGAIVDFVGYGAANCSETAPTPALSNTTSAQRKGGGATDTDNNLNDFTVGAPDPHASADQAPAVKATTPQAGGSGVTLDSDVSITFSEPVEVSGNWFSIVCASSGTHSAVSAGGPTTYTLNPSPDFASNESCTVTVRAANVTDVDADDPPNNMAADYVFSFLTADVFNCGDPATKIHDVQGSGLASPMAGSPVVVEGVVVGDYQRTVEEFGGFYLQEETSDADANPQTSEGVFVFDNGFGVDVHLGDVVRARGTATEFFNLTEIGSVNAVKVCSTGSSVPATNVSLPVASLNDLEPTESMLVHFSQTLTATEVFSLGRFGEVSLSGAGRLFTPTAVAAPGAPAQAVAAQNARSRIVLDDGNNQQNIDPTLYPQGGLSATNTLRVGDTLPGLDGVMDYRFSNYRIQPVGPIAFDHTNPRTSAPEPAGGNLKVASFNVLNFFNGNGLGGGFPTSRGANTPFEYQRQLTKEVSALTAMNADVVGLMEIENDAPPNSAIESLVNALNDAMGAGTYSFVNTGVIGTDEIKVALIYKPSSVTPVGAFKTLTTAVDPRFIDTKNRPSLAQTFESTTGARLTVVVNHLTSKGSDCNDVGDPDTGDGSGNCNITRTNAAKALVDWLATDPTGSGDPDYLLIGDMNSYTFEDPITAFTNGGFENLVRQFGGLGAYSYVFNGESGYLDHALASSSLASQAAGVAHWHINPDEPTVLDYNTEFKTANQVNTFYSPGPYRSSDHDPVIIGLDLNAAPTVDAGGPYSVPEGGTVTVAASGSDPDGGTLDYAWDLDNDGAFDDANGSSATFSAADIDGPASRTIRVQVTDRGGLRAVDEATVNVQNIAPEATFVAPPTALAGAPFTLALTNPHDPSSADTAAGFTYAFDCGAGYGAFTSSSSAVCSTNATGPRSVGGKIRDKDGGISEYRATVQVQVTAASLCALTRLYVQKNDGLANSLCVKLEHGSYRAYENEVNAQTGKALTAEQAEVLIGLARTLAG
jgi:predicted extracellular nuclease